MTNDSIGCTVDHCRYYDKKCCTLNKIKVAKCNAKDDTDKEATMCDSYECKD